MNQRVSPESLLPLSVVEPTAQVELAPLAQTPDMVRAELPALQVVEHAGESAVLPALAVATSPESSPVLAPVIATEPVIVPKVVKPSALKPAVKISRTATTVAKAKLAIDGTAPKIVPAAKEMYKSLNLKERGAKLFASAIGAVALTRAGIVKAPTKLRTLDDRAINRAKDLKETVSNAPYKARAIIKNRFTQLNESLYENKSVLAKAIGCVAVAGIAYAAVKNIDLSNAPQLVEAGDAANLGDSSGTAIDASVQITSPGKPVEIVTALDQTPAVPGQTAETFQDVFVVDGGEGIVENIMDDLAENGVEVSALEAYEIYQEQDAKLDGRLINGDTYRMSNGDLGISNSGQFAWQQEMQNALEEIAKEKKKRKS